MNTPREWEEEFEDRFVGNSDPNWMPELHRLLEKDREEIKSFIRTIEDKVREEEREKVRKLVPKGYTFKEVDWGDGVVSIENCEDDTKPRAYCEGYNQALSDIIKALNEKEA